MVTLGSFGNSKQDESFISIYSACMLSLVRLCDPMDCSQPGSSVHGILQARILEWAAISHPGDLPNRGTEPESPLAPSLAGRFFTTELPGKTSMYTRDRNRRLDCGMR